MVKTNVGTAVGSVVQKIISVEQDEKTRNGMEIVIILNECGVVSMEDNINNLVETLNGNGTMLAMFFHNRSQNFCNCLNF